MTFELTTDDAELVRGFVEGRLIELKKEINRTESMKFRLELHKMERALESLVNQLTTGPSSTH